jgi:sugar lactone lactonase YvrE
MSFEDLGYTPNVDWEQLPAELVHKDVPGVAVDRENRVYLFTRFDHQVLVYTPDGEFIKAWGNGIFSNAHAINIGPDNLIYTTDNGDHTVRKFSLDGELLLTLGLPNQPSDTGYVRGAPVSIAAVEGVKYPGPPFNGCTDSVVAPNGDIYVSDGYQNCRVHRFNSAGALLHSWGQVGSGPGEFRLPHSISLAPDGRVFVADRENDRIQIFSPDGEYLDELTDLYRPCAISVAPDGTLYVGELWREVGNRSFVADTSAIDLPSRMTIIDNSGRLVGRFGDIDDKTVAGSLIAPHSVVTDSAGDLYVGQVTYTYGVLRGLVSEKVAARQLVKFEKS